MTRKTAIIDALGETGLLLPERVNRALAANDRAKYFLTLIQAAKARADDPGRPWDDLHGEREAAGVADPAFDETVGGAEKLPGGRYRLPHGAQAIAAQLEDVAAMLAPLQENRELAERFARLRQKLDDPDDALPGETILAMASADRAKGDSLHLLVMDAHKALNRLQSRIAAESVDGAAAYGLEPEDRPRVRAFMAGLHRTESLRFDHPGLATTATRSGGRLVLQNDIGLTDAHVVVVHVEGLEAAVTYTDVHLQRLLFFQGLLERFDTAWDDTLSKKDAQVEGGVYHLTVGRYRAPDAARLEGFLELLGSRLVFLIDWNRARKRLQNLLPRRDALEVLAWAADNEFGHMAFLRAGGEQMVYDALDFVGRGQIRLGTRLNEILGRDEAREYLKFVLKTCAQALLRGEPESFIRDEVRAELSNYFRSGQQGLHDLCAEHAALTVEIAAALRDSLLHASQAGSDALLKANAARAKDWESRADELVIRARATLKRAEGAEFLASLVESADDIADELEEAAFHLTLLPVGPDYAGLYDHLRQLGELLLEGCQEFLKALESARDVRRGCREDIQEFLQAIHRIVTVEHRTDEAERTMEARLCAQAPEFGAFHIFAETAKNLEQAADALLHCGLNLRDHILGKVVAG